jgi:uncharacterized protein (TIGR00730 family)
MASKPERSRKAPIKAYKNEMFLNSPDARTVRILAEFLEPENRFERYQVSDTIVFFGSARIKPRKEAEELYAAAKAKNGKLKEAEIALEMSRYYEDARELAKKMTLWSKGLGKGQRRFIVCSGGGPGIMEASNRGAHEADGLSIGFNISLPFEQNNNPFISSELNFEFHYFFIRKYWFAYMAKALIIFPGGFGTLDELMELLTLIQTKKVKKPIPIVIYGSDYWKKVINFDEMIRMGTISAEDLDFFHFSDTPDDAFDHLTTRLKELYLE